MCIRDSYYAGDFITMYDKNPDLAFVYPQEGVNVFVDSICIPKNAKNKAAHLLPRARRIPACPQGGIGCIGQVIQRVEQRPIQIKNHCMVTVSYTHLCHV